MTDSLNLHPASPDEVIAAHQNVFPHWAKGRTLEEHIDFRLTSPTHSRANWFVGCVGERVVVSLGCYPIQFQVAGEVMSGSAIGSVYTVADFRRRGYADQLVNFSDEYQKDQGCGMSILYSDIGPAYYARCGYVLCPSLEGWRNVAADSGTETVESRLQLEEFQVDEEFSEMALMYDAYHSVAPISIVRDDDYWQYLIRKFPDDRYFWLQEPDGGRAGYVRLTFEQTECCIVDYALANQNDELAEEFYAALIASARSWQIESLGGWLPDSPAAKRFFELVPREKEITMIKPLTYSGGLSADLIASTNRFCEIDHV